MKVLNVTSVVKSYTKIDVKKAKRSLIGCENTRLAEKQWEANFELFWVFTVPPTLLKFRRGFIVKGRCDGRGATCNIHVSDLARGQRQLDAVHT